MTPPQHLHLHQEHLKQLWVCRRPLPVDRKQMEPESCLMSVQPTRPGNKHVRNRGNTSQESASSLSEPLILKVI